MRQASAVQKQPDEIDAWERSIAAMRRVTKERDDAEARADDLQVRLTNALNSLANAQADNRELTERCQRLERANTRIVTMGDTIVREFQAMQGELHANDLGVKPSPKLDLAKMERELGELAESLGDQAEVIDAHAAEYLGAEAR